MIRAIALSAILAAAPTSTCFSCAPSAPAHAAIDPHVVTNDQCAVLTLKLDSGVTKNICLTADQLEQALENTP